MDNIFVVVGIILIACALARTVLRGLFDIFFGN